jgi:hypothetical protein
VLVNSAWWPETEEVAAFEELVGSHGGLGGGRWPGEPLVGTEHTHRLLRSWLADLGHAACREG